MRICKLALGLALLGLAGCSDFLSVKRAAAPTQVQLADGLIVSGTMGWCVDPSTSQTSGETVVVVLGSCSALDQDVKSPRPDVPGMVTVTVDQGAAPSPALLRDYFETTAGRAALAQNGSPDSIEIVEVEAQEDRLMLRTADSSALPGASSDVWRALFELEGRFVSVSLYALADEPIQANVGWATVEAQVDQLKAINGI